MAKFICQNRPESIVYPKNIVYLLFNVHVTQTTQFLEISSLGSQKPLSPGSHFASDHSFLVTFGDLDFHPNLKNWARFCPFLPTQLCAHDFTTYVLANLKSSGKIELSVVWFPPAFLLGVHGYLRFWHCGVSMSLWTCFFQPSLTPEWGSYIHSLMSLGYTGFDVVLLACFLI